MTREKDWGVENGWGREIGRGRENNCLGRRVGDGDGFGECDWLGEGDG